MYCREVIYKEYTQKQGTKIPRERYLTYYRDFSRYYGLEFIESSAFYGSQLDGVELMNPIMDKLAENHDLNQIRYCIFADWLEDFDSEYSALGAYIIDKYHLNAKLFNVVDQGLLSIITALKLAKLSHENVLMLSFDQTTITQFKNISELRPDVSGAAALLLSISSPPDFFKILEAEIISDQKKFILDNFNLPKLKLIKIKGIGLMPFYKKMQELKKNSTSGYYVLLIQDVESDSCGYVVIHKGEKDENI